MMSHKLKRVDSNRLRKLFHFQFRRESLTARVANDRVQQARTVRVAAILFEAERGEKSAPVARAQAEGERVVVIQPAVKNARVHVHVIRAADALDDMRCRRGRFDAEIVRGLFLEGGRRRAS